MGREFELKYRADSDALDQISSRFGPFDTISMETDYYDSPEGALRARHWMLRKRLENGAAVCTLKTPLPGGSRGEWEVSAPSIEEALPLLLAAGCPGELEDLARPGLLLWCGARFTRLARKVSCADSVLELALDQGVFLGGGQEQPFAELEVELKEGTDADCRTFAQALAGAYGLVPEEKGKAQRAFALAEQRQERL